MIGTIAHSPVVIQGVMYPKEEVKGTLVARSQKFGDLRSLESGHGSDSDATGQP